MKVSKFLEVLPDCFRELPISGFENLLWALYYLTDNEQVKIKNFMKLNMVGSVIEMAKGNEESKWKIPAVRILGNISTSDDQDVGVRFYFIFQ